MRKVIQILLALVVVALAYLLVESIMSPIRFEKVRTSRYKVTVKRLMNIRNAQVAYKTVNGKYTASFDTLVTFVREGQLPLVRAIGTIPDEFVDSLKSLAKAEALALKLGLISRDTIRISVMDSLFKRPSDLDSMVYIPYSGGKKFEMGIAEVKASGLPVQVFEASALNFDILKGLDEQLIVNLNDGKPFPGLKVGSLNESNNNAGNWETSLE
ncbi:MAG: hypothetical protein RBR35_10370 [Salinivirgaceae bacterium]|nr:hypothetical protein [Salinivirgaceae bacterium]